MRFIRFIFALIPFALHAATGLGQQKNDVDKASKVDSVNKVDETNISQIPLKFISATNAKIDKYTNRLTSKTEKTLAKLARWEEKIHKLLLQTSPQTAAELFAEGRPTFASMLAKVKEGKSLAESYSKRYEAYNDKLVTNIKFIESKKDELDKKYIVPLQKAKEATKKLEEDVAQTEAAEKMIKERTHELLKAAYKVLGKNSILSKMAAEHYTYVETLKNYKELFQDSKKAEQKALEILGKIPAVQEFVKNNSMLASLFGSPSAGASAASLAGLQTRASVNNLIQNRIAAGGPNAAAQISANMQAAQSELGKLKDKYLTPALSTGGEGVDGLPNFRKKEVKSKTFKQRIELGSNFQFGRPSRYTSSQMDIGVNVGYRVSDNSTIYGGISYKLNYGSIDNFYLQHGGFSLRSGYDVKLKKQFFLSSGYELNYNQSFKSFSEILNAYGTSGIGNPLQSSALIGISKKINMKTKFVKGTKLSLLYDVLYNSHIVPTQALVLRTGFNF
jgi:hypothetical protein